MNPELAIARCSYEGLKLRLRELEMEIADTRQALRETVAPYVADKDIDVSRLIFLSAKLVTLVQGEDKEKPGLFWVMSEMGKLKREYNL